MKTRNTKSSTDIQQDEGINHQLRWLPSAQEAGKLITINFTFNGQEHPLEEKSLLRRLQRLLWNKRSLRLPEGGQVTVVGHKSLSQGSILIGQTSLRDFLSYNIFRDVTSCWYPPGVKKIQVIYRKDPLIQDPSEAILACPKAEELPALASFLTFSRRSHIIESVKPLS